jgi:hypothetical protein
MLALGFSPLDSMKSETHDLKNEMSRSEGAHVSLKVTLPALGREGVRRFLRSVTKVLIRIDLLHQRRELGEEPPTPRKRLGVGHRKLKPASKA